MRLFALTRLDAELARSYFPKTHGTIIPQHPNLMFGSPPPDKDKPTATNGLDSPEDEEAEVVERSDGARELDEVPVGRGEMAPQ